MSKRAGHGLNVALIEDSVMFAYFRFISRVMTPLVPLLLLERGVRRGSRVHRVPRRPEPRSGGPFPPWDNAQYATTPPGFSFEIVEAVCNAHKAMDCRVPQC